MNMSNWTLEERERYAYITGSPLTKLLGVASDGVDKKNVELKDLIDTQEDEIQKQSDHITELEQTIEVLQDAAKATPEQIDIAKDIERLCAGTL